MKKLLLALFLFTHIAFGSGFFGGGGASTSIGGAVVGGTDKSVLFVDPTSTLAQDNPNFIYTLSTHQLSVAGGILFDGTTLLNSTAADPSSAGFAAAIGSILTRNNSGSGQLWFKYATGNTNWVNVLTAATGWGVLGNSGLSATSNFLGTTDATDLVLKSNSTEGFRIKSGGGIQISPLTTGIGHFDSSGNLTSSAIVNADISASAAIVLSKLATQGADTIVGNNTGSTAVPTALSVAQVNAILPVFTNTLNGLAPLSGGGTTNFLRADQTWAAPPPGTVTSVGFSVPASSIFGASGSPVTTSGTLGLTVTGTSGGIPYFDTTSTLSSSALLTNHAIVLGGGAGASPTVLGSLGTSTTVLHGAAAGAPTFSAVALATDVSGTLQAAQFPALTGDITTTAGALGTTLATVNSNVGSFTSANITVNAKGLVTAASNGTASLTFVAPTTQIFTSGTGTYTLPTSPRTPLYIEVEMIGAGGGGSGGGTASGGAGGTGGNTTFGTGGFAVCNGGTGGSWGGGPNPGGTVSLTTSPAVIQLVALQGGAGNVSFGGATGASSDQAGQYGASSPFGGAGSGNFNASAGGSAIANSGSGAGGGGGGASGIAGGGAGAGGYLKFQIFGGSLTNYTYAIGAGGTAGSAGSSGGTGGVGGSGFIKVREFYQ